jgi:hypothetical protein
MFADWLQENGNAERAEFIRLQVEARGLVPDYLSEESRSRMTRLVQEHGQHWRQELPLIEGVVWNTLFVRGFIEFAEVFARPNISEQLARAFAAAPLVRIIVHYLNEEELSDLLECPFLHRLTSLVMPELNCSRLSAELNEKLIAVARRLKSTRLIYLQDV